MDAAERLILLETPGGRPASNERRPFKNRSYQPPDDLESPRNALVAHLATLKVDQRLVVGLVLGFYLASLGLGVTTVLAIDLATDPVVRSFFQDLLKLGGVAKDAEDFIMNKPELPIPITMASSLFIGTKINLSYTQAEERDVVRYGYFFEAMCCLIGTKIRDYRRDEGNQMALLNAVYVCAGQPLGRVLDARHVALADKRIPLAQTTLRGVACSIEPVATPGEFTSCLRYATHLTAMATDLNPATLWQIEVYAEDLTPYAAAREAY